MARGNNPFGSGDPIEAMLQEVSSRLGGVDELLVRQMHSFSSILNEICKKVNSSDMLGVRRELKSMFNEPEALGNFSGGSGQMYNVLPVVYANLAGHINGVIDDYDRLIKRYATLENAGLETALGRGKESSIHAASFSRALFPLIQTTVKGYITGKADFPEILERTYKAVIAYNNYLRKKFIKTEEDKHSVQKFLLFDPREEEPVKYVKIELVEGNPVLTDLLLRLVDEIPVPQERQHLEKRRKKKAKEVSKYAVEDAAEKLFNCADTHFLEYVTEPRVFFEQIGNIVQRYYTFSSSLDEVSKKVVDLPNLQILGDIEDIEKIIRTADRRIQNGIAKLKRLDFEAIVQNKDDVQPDNRRERDYFKVRGKLIGLLYGTLTELAESKDGEDVDDDLQDDTDSKYDTDFQESLMKTARETVMKAVELKAEMEEIATSHTQRQLRKDKASDNEFYVGRQGEIGRFYFDREPTPKVKLDEVIGASFDQAKSHLREVIETGSYSRVMRLSAPGGKVRSNILLIGPYGCGKTELARAVCGDERVIGASVSVASTLTAYMHESVNNVKRVYDAAKVLRQEARDMKPVLLTLDEFDGWFAHSEHGGYSETDMQQIENIMLEVLDGMEDYNGIITMAMTNKPKMVPKGIMRRFRYVDIVGELTTEERAGLLKMYLEKTLPLHESVPENYSRWAEKLADAPGDVVRKVVDELHFQKVPLYLRANPSKAERIEKVLSGREMNKGELNEKDIVYVRETLRRGGVIITPLDVEHQIDQLLVRPAVRMQINAAREVYRDAKRLLEDLASGEGRSYGMKHKSNLFES